MPDRLISTNFTAGELSPRMYGRVDLDKYQNGVELMQNIYSQPHGGATRRPGFIFIREIMGRDRTVTTWTHDTGWSGTGDSLVCSGAQTAATETYQAALPGITGRMYEVEFTISSHVAGGVAVRTALETGATVTADGDYRVRLEASTDAFIHFIADADFNASVTDITIREVGPKAKLIPFEYSTEQAYILEFTDENMRIYRDGGIVTDGTSPIEVTTPYTEDDLDRISYTQSADVMDLVHPEVTPQTLSRTSHTAWTMADTSFTWTGVTNDWNSTDGYPSCVTYFEERKVFAGSPAHPQRIWMSDNSDYNTFSKSTPLVDTDACVYTLSADQANSIRALVSRTKLIILTSGGEWWMAGGAGTDQVTPTSVKTSRSTTYGSRTFLPVTVGHVVLFIQRDSRVIRELSYSFENDDYLAPDVSVLAEHLFRGFSLTDWAYQQTPGSVVWIIRDDGKLISLTYQREHEVIGYAQHDTPGEFESVASVYGNDSDELWVVVKRTVDGEDRRYVEQMGPEFDGEDTTDAFFVDSGLSYNGAPTTSLSGLDHLEGETLAVLADGAVMPPVVVADGEITIPVAASVVHAGLAYESNLFTLRIEAGPPTLQGAKKRITHITVRLLNSLGLSLGPNADSLKVLPFRSNNDPLNNAPALFSGDYSVVFSGGYSKGGQMYFRQDQPLPLTILALIPTIITEGR